MMTAALLLLPLLQVPLVMMTAALLLLPLLQVPLIMMTDALRKKLNRDDWGNYVFWITFCVVGQPVSVLMYYHDYVVKNSAQLQRT